MCRDQYSNDRKGMQLRTERLNVVGLGSGTCSQTQYCNSREKKHFKTRKVKDERVKNLFTDPVL